MMRASANWLRPLLLLNLFLSFGLVALSFLTLPQLGFAQNSLFDDVLIAFYMIVTLIGHIGLFIITTVCLIQILAVFLQDKHIKILSIFVMAMTIAYLTADTLIFRLFNFHLHGIFVSFIISGHCAQFFRLSIIEWLSILLVCVAILGFESGIIYYFSSPRNLPLPTLPTLYSVVLGCAVISYLFFLLAASDATQDPQTILRNHAITLKARLFPLYTNTIAMLLPQDMTLSMLEHRGAGILYQPQAKAPKLNYPSKPIVCEMPSNPVNIIVLIIDTWRFDMLNAMVMPNIYRFAQHAQVLPQHFSGGNATIPGLVSLFYGIPPTYWPALMQQHIPSPLVQLAQLSGYHFGIFSSSHLSNPPLAQTLFANISASPVYAKPQIAYTRDKHIIRAFGQFLTTAPQPFWGFLMLDSAHGYCDPAPYSPHFTPITAQCQRLWLNKHSDPKPYINRYKNALYELDRLLKPLLTQLISKHLLKNTVLIITGDHGEEFNDNQQNYWGHASNYTKYQTQVPFILMWPTQQPLFKQTITTHYDILPTLLSSLWHCRRVDELSVGHSLFTRKYPYFFIQGSYVDFAVREKDRITTIYPSGNYMIFSLQQKPRLRAQPNWSVLQNAQREMTKFYTARQAKG